MMRIAALLPVSLLIFAFALPARALQQPNGATIPTAPGCNGNQPTGLLAAFACACTQPGICNIGAPCPSQSSCDDGMHGTCESTMWHAFNDNTCIPTLKSGLDPVAEAAVTPETFHPTCALTFTVVTRGTAMFKDTFGWYNVTGKAPALADLHPMLACGDGPGKAVVLDIQKEPAYTGGDIAFFLLSPESHTSKAACADGDCCPTLARAMNGEGYAYYSERKWNPDQNGASSYIHLLTYDSHLVKRKFYFAWEDTFGGSNNDFTDVVASVDGVECSGGGQACDTGKMGVCAAGVTTCAAGCVEVVPAKAEMCNGVDDDCNGMADDNAPCPIAGDVCQNGACVPHCGSAEFPCATGTACDGKSGLCVAPSCVGVSCVAGETCQGGTCVLPCNGVVCPHGQSCVGNVCTDACKGVTCAAGQACRGGSCFPGCAACDGVVCGAPLTCDVPSGDCVDPSCAAGCPGGTFCKSGACVDACIGAKCPNGQSCTHGVCGGGATSDPGADGGLLAVDNADGGPVGPNADDPTTTGAGKGCACSMTDASGYTAGAPLAVLAGAALWGRRRRRRFADRC